MYAYFYLRNLLEAIKNGEEGQDLIEYALIIVVLVVLAFVGLNALGQGIDGVYDTITAWLAGGAAPTSPATP